VVDGGPIVHSNELLCKGLGSYLASRSSIFSGCILIYGLHILTMDLCCDRVVEVDKVVDFKSMVFTFDL
jgi:hypothetical protein